MLTTRSKTKETPQQLTRKEESLVQYREAYAADCQHIDLIRRGMVSYALEHGVKETATHYRCHRNTISKWVNRFHKEGLYGLCDRSHAPQSIPHKICDPRVVDKILGLRDRTGYGAERLGVEASTFMTYVFEHFKRHGVDPKGLTIQVDGISYAHSFKSLKKTAFRELIESYGAKLRIKPGGGTNQGDVESFHSLIEEEFYDRQSFSSKQDFYLKAYQYIYSFNFIRKNRHKDWKTPVYYLSQDQPKVSPDVLDLPPIYLEAHSDLYFAKLDPYLLTAKEEELLDTPPDQLPVKDYHPEEYLDSFVHRVYAAEPKQASFHAHDQPGDSSIP